MTNPVKEKYPRLYAKCLELAEGDDHAARVLATLIVMTAPQEGKGGVVLDGEPMSLPAHVKAMKLHELIGAAN